MSEKLPSKQKQESTLEVGKWIGRSQALGVVAAKCTAADAQCMKRLRDEKAHRKLGLTWTEFCRRELGATRPTVDRTIRLLEDYGPAYFRLNEFVRLGEPEYRRIAAAVSENAIRVNREEIPLSQENSGRISAAVKEMLAARAAAVPAVDSESRRVGRIAAVAKGCRARVESILAGEMTGGEICDLQEFLCTEWKAWMWLAHAANQR